MIKGIGTDIISIQRISLDDHFVSRILTSDEIVLFNAMKSTERQQEFLAGRFAAKEAIMKAIGTGIGESSFQDFTILPDAKGQPQCTITGYLVHLSISHDAGMAVAFAVVEDEL
jgi:holo-[acyl-carrier protein] synthase